MKITIDTTRVLENKGRLYIDRNKNGKADSEDQVLVSKHEDGWRPLDPSTGPIDHKAFDNRIAYWQDRQATHSEWGGFLKMKQTIVVDRELNDQIEDDEVVAPSSKSTSDFLAGERDNMQVSVVEGFTSYGDTTLFNAGTELVRDGDKLYLFEHNRSIPDSPHWVNSGERAKNYRASTLPWKVQ